MEVCEFRDKIIVRIVTSLFFITNHEDHISNQMQFVINMSGWITIGKHVIMEGQ